MPLFEAAFVPPVKNGETVSLAMVLSIPPEWRTRPSVFQALGVMRMAWEELCCSPSLL